MLNYANKTFDHISLVFVALLLFPSISGAQGQCLYETPTWIPVGSEPHGVAFGDLNGNFNQDIVSADLGSNSISVLLNDGAGGYGTATTYPVGTQPISVAIGNLDGLYGADIVVANFMSDTVSVLLSNGWGGSFSSAVNYNVGAGPRHVILGDMDGDSDLEIVTANRDNDSVSVLLNNGDGTFGVQTEYIVGDGPHSVAMGDVNNDGNPDVVCSNQFAGTCNVLTGAGNGGFDAITVLPYTLNSIHSVQLGDLNVDGKLDLVATSRYSDSIFVLFGDAVGHPYFSAPATYATGVEPQRQVLGDVNGDSFLDIVTANRLGGTVSVFLNSGDGIFDSRFDFFAGNEPRDVAIADINGDQALELVTANSNGNELGVLMHTPPYSNWTNVSGGDFGIANNWDTATPGMCATAIFGIEAAFNVNLSQDHTVAALQFLEGIVYLDPQGFSLTSESLMIDGATVEVAPGLLVVSGSTTLGSGVLTLATGSLSTTDFDNSASGSFNVQAGGSFSNAANGYIGRLQGSTGTATVDGTGSLWNNTGGLFLGGSDTADGGTGMLTISNLGQVNVGDAVYGGGLGALNVSDSGTNGKLWVRNGSTIDNSGFGFIGFDVGTAGNATVTGDGSQWNNTEQLRVGDSGTGTLDVLAGGQVSNSIGYIGLLSGSHGTVNVNGVNSQWNNSSDLYVANNAGVGNLNVQAGGVVNNANGIMGFDSDSIANALVTGPGSHWNNSGQLHVGASGNATIDVLAGGQISNTIGFVGLHAGSDGTVTVDGTNSQWSNSDQLRVGNSGNATLDILEGGQVTNTLGYIGLNSGSDGTATVNGSGSLWSNSSDLYIGLDGNAAMNVQAGGAVECVSGIIGLNIGSEFDVTITGSGSQWNNSANLLVGGNNTESGGTGTLTIDDGGLVSVGGVTKVWSTATMEITDGSLSVFNLFNEGMIKNGGQIDISGTLTNFGTLMGDGLLTGNVENDGLLTPGNSAGVLSIAGDWTQGSNGTLEIELGGVFDGDGDHALTEFDWMDVTGDVQLAGSLNVQLIDGFELQDLMSFEILNIDGNLTGGFDGLDEGALVGNFGGIDLIISYVGGDGNDVVLLASEPSILLGDVNLDGIVNLLDVDPFIEVLALSSYQAEADINQDGEVNLLDIDPFILIVSGS